MIRMSVGARLPFEALRAGEADAAAS